MPSTPCGHPHTGRFLPLMTFDPFTIIMLAVLAVLIFFMFRNSRKRQADARDAAVEGPGRARRS